MHESTMLDADFAKSKETINDIQFNLKYRITKYTSYSIGKSYFTTRHMPSKYFQNLLINSLSAVIKYA